MDEHIGTPRTDSCLGNGKKTIGQLRGDLEDLARELERELVTSTRSLDRTTADAWKYINDLERDIAGARKTIELLNTVARERDIAFRTLKEVFGIDAKGLLDAASKPTA